MLYQTEVILRGKKTHIKNLKSNTDVKLIIICPDCNTSFLKYFKVLNKIGNFQCQKCRLKSLYTVNPNIGDKFNRITVIEILKEHKILGKCECGNIKEFTKGDVVIGSIKSCGCLQKEKVREYYSNPANIKYGVESSNWKGGVSRERDRVMSTVQYSQWRKSVFERDNYTCQKCKQKGYQLEAHHIIPYSIDFTKILDINNGITFCKKCHKQYHSIYGVKKATEENLQEFTTKI